MMQSLRIIFAGSGAFGVPTLRGILDAGHEIVQVVTQPDRPAGRGRKMTPTPVGEFGIENKLAVVRTENINALELPAADVMVVIAFGQKVGQAKVNWPRLGSVNLHASLLPKYRGAAPINWAILNGERETGNSVIRLAERMDAGAVLGQSRVEIGEMETAGELHDRLAMDGGPLILKVLEELAAGKAVERAQDEAAATTAPKLSRKDAAIDFGEAAEVVARKVRGLYPWPGCRVRILKEGEEIGRVTLVRGVACGDSPHPSSGPGYRERGTVGVITATGAVNCGAGSIEVVEVQPEGKKGMSLGAYKNGHEWPVGGRVEAVS